MVWRHTKQTVSKDYLRQYSSHKYMCRDVSKVAQFTSMWEENWITERQRPEKEEHMQIEKNWLVKFAQTSYQASPSGWKLVNDLSREECCSCPKLLIHNFIDLWQRVLCHLLWPSKSLWARPYENQPELSIMLLVIYCFEVLSFYVLYLEVLRCFCYRGYHCFLLYRWQIYHCCVNQSSWFHVWPTYLAPLDSLFHLSTVRTVQYLLEWIHSRLHFYCLS